MLLKHVFSLCDKDQQIKVVTLHVQVLYDPLKLVFVLY